MYSIITNPLNKMKTIWSFSKSFYSDVLSRISIMSIMFALREHYPDGFPNKYCVRLKGAFYIMNSIMSIMFALT